MKLVYVAGPFRGKSHWDVAENVRNAERLALEIWRAGFACFCPHANTAHFDGAAEDKIWLEGDLEILRRCDAVVMTPDFERSTGAKAERDFAVRHAIPVYYSIRELLHCCPHDSEICKIN